VGAASRFSRRYISKCLNRYLSRYLEEPYHTAHERQPFLSCFSNLKVSVYLSALNNHRSRRQKLKRGGTFTDCVGNPGTGKLEDDIIIKLLSVDPQNYDDAPLEGIRRLLEKFSGEKISRGEALDTTEIGWRTL